MEQQQAAMYKAHSMYKIEDVRAKRLIVATFWSHIKLINYSCDEQEFFLSILYKVIQQNFGMIVIT